MFGITSFSEAPFSAEALNNYQFSCSAGSYTFSGASAAFSYVRAVIANAGSFALTGNNAGLHNDKVLQSNAGTYSLTGFDAEFDYDQVLIGEGGSYAITGNSASFATGKSLIAGTFSYLWTGNNAELLQSKIFNSEPGAYSIVGGSVTFFKGKTLTANAGSYIFAGQNADLVYAPIPVVITESRGGIGKKEKKKRELEKASREELEAIVKREFDILDGTYQPEVTEKVKSVFIPQIKQIDLNKYNIAIAQVNALLLQAKIKAAEYESELDDEEALLMLL